MSEANLMHRYTEQQLIHQFWAGKLVECLKKMGERQTNAVLLALDGVKQIKPYQHYPKSSFTFGNGDWKVFYHCHKSPDNEIEEHGHFHYFTRTYPIEAESGSNTDKWSHVIAMGMDELGQPTRLFTTNLWVTDGDWFDSKLSQAQFKLLRDSEEKELSNNWFKYLLLTFEKEIEWLLSKRDQVVKQHYPDNYKQCFIDRSIYCLSSLDINLNEKLIEIFQPASQLNS